MYSVFQFCRFTWSCFCQGFIHSLLLMLFILLLHILIMERRAWKNIWSLEIPNKYKHLVWRACRNSLPTKQNMVRRTIIQQSSCDHCSLQAEDTLHALLSCTGLDEAWNGDDGVFGLQCNLMTLWRCVAGL